MHTLAFALALAAQVSPPGDDPALTLDVFRTLLTLITNGPAVGGLATAAGIVVAVTRLTKLDAVRRFLGARDLAWLTPILAAALGGIGALLTAIAGGEPLAAAVVAAVAGVLAGLTGVGLHEVGRGLSPTERSRVRVDGPALKEASQALAREIERETPLPEVRAKVAEAAAMSPGKQAEALAGLLRRSP